MIILSIFFFITAILYSSVGFGGGSTYLALLLIWDTPYYIFPVIALFCNIIVVTGNSVNYIRAGNHNLKLLLPFLIGSIPFAYIGGTLIINKEIFEILLFLVLSVAGILLLMSNKAYENKDKNIITTASLFILVNSISGIFGQFTKDDLLNEFLIYWPLFFGVFIGGLIGNYLNLKIFSNRVLALITSFLVIFVAARMAFKIFF